MGFPPPFISASFSPHCWERYNEVTSSVKEEGGRNAEGHKWPQTLEGMKIPDEDPK